MEVLNHRPYRALSGRNGTGIWYISKDPSWKSIITTFDSLSLRNMAVISNVYTMIIDILRISSESTLMLIPQDFMDFKLFRSMSPYVTLSWSNGPAYIRGTKFLITLPAGFQVPIGVLPRAGTLRTTKERLIISHTFRWWGDTAHKRWHLQYTLMLHLQLHRNKSPLWYFQVAFIFVENN